MQCYFCVLIKCVRTTAALFVCSYCRFNAIEIAFMFSAYEVGSSSM